MRHCILISLLLASSVASADIGDRGGVASEPLQVAAATEPGAPAPVAADPEASSEASDAAPDAPTDVTLATTSLQATAMAACMSLATAATSMALMATTATLESETVADEEETAPVVLAKVPSAQELRLQYQRIGRDLLKLEEQRGKFDCGGVIPRFKAIKLDDALGSTATRAKLAVELAAMSIKIDRLHGIHIDAACLQNPLAAGCM